MLLHPLLGEGHLGLDLVLLRQGPHLDVARALLLVGSCNTRWDVEQAIVVVDEHFLQGVLEQLLHGGDVVLAEDLVLALADCGDCDDQPRLVGVVLSFLSDASLEVVGGEVLVQLLYEHVDARGTCAEPHDDHVLLQAPEVAVPNLQ